MQQPKRLIGPSCLHMPPARSSTPKSPPSSSCSRASPLLSCWACLASPSADRRWSHGQAEEPVEHQEEGIQGRGARPGKCSPAGEAQPDGRLQGCSQASLRLSRLMGAHQASRLQEAVPGRAATPQAPAGAATPAPGTRATHPRVPYPQGTALALGQGLHRRSHPSVSPARAQHVDHSRSCSSRGPAAPPRARRGPWAPRACHHGHSPAGLRLARSSSWTATPRRPWQTPAQSCRQGLSR